MRIFRRTILESPFSVPTPDGIARNLRYCRAAMRDSLLQGDAPMVSHALYTQPGVLDDTNPTERAMGIEAGLTWGDAAVATVVYCDLGITPGMRQGIERAAKEQRPVEFRSLAGWTVAGEVASVSTATVAAATTTVTSSPMTDAAPERVDVIGFHAPRLLAAKRARYERNLPDYPDPRTLSCEFCSAVEGAPCTEIVTWWCSDNCARHLIASAPGKCPCGARLVPSEPSVHPTRPLGRPFGHHTPHKGKRSTKAPKPDAAPIQSTPPPEEIAPVVVTPRKTLRGRANVTLTAPTTATVAPSGERATAYGSCPAGRRTAGTRPARSSARRGPWATLSETTARWKTAPTPTPSQRLRSAAPAATATTRQQQHCRACTLTATS